MSAGEVGSNRKQPEPGATERTRAKTRAGLGGRGRGSRHPVAWGLDTRKPQEGTTLGGGPSGHRGVQVGNFNEKVWRELRERGQRRRTTRPDFRTARPRPRRSNSVRIGPAAPYVPALRYGWQRPSFLRAVRNLSGCGRRRSQGILTRRTPLDPEMAGQCPVRQRSASCS
jgi:hypothetical protein